MDTILQIPVTPKGQISALYNIIVSASNTSIEKM